MAMLRAAVLLGVAVTCLAAASTAVVVVAKEPKCGSGCKTFMDCTTDGCPLCNAYEGVCASADGICGMRCGSSTDCGGDCQACSNGRCAPTHHNGTCAVSCGDDSDCGSDTDCPVCTGAAICEGSAAICGVSESRVRATVRVWRGMAWLSARGETSTCLRQRGGLLR